MFCPKCGSRAADGIAFCSECGARITQDQPEVKPAVQKEPTMQPPQTWQTPAYRQGYQAPYQPAQPIVIQHEITQDQLPAKFRPLSAWAYFGYGILFSIPIVGFIFLIIFSISSANINRRSFARSYWCGLILIAIIAGLTLLILLITGNSYIIRRYL